MGTTEEKLQEQIEKNLTLQSQLEMAVRALKDIIEDHRPYQPWEIAEKALEEIKSIEE